MERRQEQNHKFIDVQRCTDKNKKGQVLSVTRGARAHDRAVFVETYGVRLECTELRPETTRQAAFGYSVVRQSLSLSQSERDTLSETTVAL